MLRSLLIFEGTMLEFSIRLDWSELDLFGHINNVSYFKFIQAARVNLWEECGISSYFQKTQVGPMLASCSCDFKQPLFFPGNILVRTRVTHIGTTSFQTEHSIYNHNNEIAAIGKDAMVYFDFNKNEKTPIPGWLKEKLEKIH